MHYTSSVLQLDPTKTPWDYHVRTHYSLGEPMMLHKFKVSHRHDQYRVKCTKINNNKKDYDGKYFGICYPSILTLYKMELSSNQTL